MDDQSLYINLFAYKRLVNPHNIYLIDINSFYTVGKSLSSKA